MPRTFVIGTRGSKLALRQVEIVREALEREHPEISIEVRQIRTEGDASSESLSEIGGVGVFTKAIEDALIDGRADIAVHSMKDLPARLAPGLVIAAVPERADVRDALVTRDGQKLQDLGPGARIGTGSARRAVQLLVLRPDIQPVEIRGNVDTRIRKVEQGDYDAAVLAMAGLGRLGLLRRVSQTFSIEEMTPAVGQACIAIEVREDDREAREVLRSLDHQQSHVAARAERAFLARLGAGCRLPVGAWTEQGDGDVLTLHGMLATGGDPSTILRATWTGAIREAEEIGTALAETLIGQAGPGALESMAR